MARVYGLASLVKAVRRCCRALELWAPIVRRYVPSDRLPDYDAAVAALLAACAVLLSVAYQDDDPGTNPPWGEQ